ncbi:unnamed protein product [Anisakis simplex]|uniref:CUB domain-containing protein n=1 Tax=Anisakis simplex TaxID=6269 RepID=A0A0M3IYP7_ANISI|nr:unnamed protein product [Anisakis simplex]
MHMEKGDTKRLLIVGEECYSELTIVRVYEDTGSGKSDDYFETSSYLGGSGILNYVVTDGLQPRMRMRAGVFCGFGDCGHG